MAQNDQDTTLDAFGITEEEIEKTQDILPTFDLSKLELESKVVLTFLEDLPKEVEVKDVFAESKGKPKDSKITAKVIKVAIDTVFRAEKNGYVEIPYNGQPHSLWLSSKTLSLSLARLSLQSPLKGKKVKIHVGEATYKFGKNRCYTASFVN